MAYKLFSLFDDKLKTQKDLISTEVKTLELISTDVNEQEYAIKKIQQFEEVKPKIDFSNFSNFVFFNSALDYFIITVLKIIKEYPFDGSRDLIESFMNDIDDYQRHVVSVFPKSIGYLQFNPSISSSYIKVEDHGYDYINNIANTGLLSTGTGSVSIDFWCIPPPALTGSNDAMILAQKISGSNNDGYTVYFSGSRVYFNIKSGSNTDSISSICIPGAPAFFSCVYDNDSSIISIASGSSNFFPKIVSSSSLTITNKLHLGGVPFYIGSGSNFSDKIIRGLTGSIDDVKFWNYPRTIQQTSSSFNIRQRSQSGLVANWTFNETGSVPHIEYNSSNQIVMDYSGHKLNGRINNYFSTLRFSGSLLPYDSLDLILNLEAPEVRVYVEEQQNSGSLYDRENDNIITNLIPAEYIKLEQFKNTHVLENFLFILARNFDYLKTRIDQFVYVLRQNYGNYNQTPDSLLADIGKFFGWEFTGNFLSSDVTQYILGKNILHNVDTNRELEKKLFEIKNEFWKRTLLNLPHLYKTKGTRESIESLLRIYGINDNIVKLKEFGFRPNVGISTERINVEKSIPTLAFGSGTASGSANISSPIFTSSLGTIEFRVRFPTTQSFGMTPTLSTGSIWKLSSQGNFGFPFLLPFLLPGAGNKDSYHLMYEKPAVDAITGSLILSSSEGSISITGTRIFDDKWYDISFTRNVSSGTLQLDVRSIENGEINYFVTGTYATASLVNDLDLYHIRLGSSGSFGSQFWGQELKIWNVFKDKNELDDHSLNFQSYGSNVFNGEEELNIHWRLRENVSASAGGLISIITDVSTNNYHGTGSGFVASLNPYKKFLNEYNFIAPPEYGWTENMVRYLPYSDVKATDAFTGNNILALEFNMIDALNEDISQIISSLDEFNYAIGLPANRYRNSYDDLGNLRKRYFKRLRDRLNFRLFSDMLEFFDRSFIDMVRRLIPINSNFIGDQFVVESHMLERPKYQWEYVRQQRELDLTGVITIYERT